MSSQNSCLISQNPSDAKLNELIVTLQRVGDGQSSGAKTAREYAARLLEIAATSADASMRLKALREMTDSLTSSQDRALKQAQQELFITRQTGDEVKGSGVARCRKSRNQSRH
jgi:hypothetical protein